MASAGDPFNHQVHLDGGPSPSIWQDMRDLPAMQKFLVATAFVLLVMLFVQSLFMLPTIIVKFGWGYGV